jgi:hypothetical protein
MTVVALLELALLLLNAAVFCASVMQLYCMGLLFPAQHTAPAQMLAIGLSCVGLSVGSCFGVALCIGLPCFYIARCSLVRFFAWAASVACCLWATYMCPAWRFQLQSSTPT